MTDRRLGRLKSPHDPRDLMAATYLAAVPVAPASIDYSTSVKRWYEFGNDAVGDCTIAAQAHQIMAWTANASGHPGYMTTANVLKRYEEVSGYVPGDESTDVGANERDVLKLWLKEPLAGHSLDAFAQVQVPKHRTDQNHFRQALWVFGGLYLGLDLPITAQEQIQDGKPWDIVGGSPDAAPGSWGGHAVNAVAFNDIGVTVVTWGALQLLSWQFLAAYCSEAWSLVSRDWLRAGKSPSGFALAQLEADLKALRS